MDQALRAILLGGVGEVGKNSTLFEYDDQMLMVDAGVKFPEAELHGVDLVIPDFGYVVEAADDLRGDHRHARPRGSHRGAARS